MTNDGELAHALSKAAAGVEKTYLVKVSGVPARRGWSRFAGDRHSPLAATRCGGTPDRIVTAPALVELVRAGDNPVRGDADKGLNRQWRKMFEEIGHHAREDPSDLLPPRLDVPPGEFRELKPGEAMALERAAQGKKAVPRKRMPEFAQLKAPGMKETEDRCELAGYVQFPGRLAGWGWAM